MIPNIEKSSVYKMYRDYGLTYWKYIAVAVLLGAISTSLTQVPQIAFGLIIETIDQGVASSQFPLADRFLSSESGSRVVEVSAVFLVSIVLVAVLSFYSRYTWDIFQEKFQRDLRVSTYQSVQNLHPNRFIERSSGTYLSVVESDVKEVGNLPRTVISGVSNDIINVLTIGLVLFSLNWQFAIVLLLPVPFIAWYTFKFNNIIDPLYKETRKASATLTQQLSSSIRGVLTVRSYVAEDREKERVGEASNEVKEAQLDVSKKWLLYSQVFNVTSRISTFIILSLGAFWVISGPPLFFTETLTAGELAVFFTNSTLLIQPVTSLHYYVDSYKDAQASSDRIYAVQEMEKSDNKSYENEFEEISGDIEFDSVEFNYQSGNSDPLADAQENDEDEEDLIQESENDSFHFGPVSCKLESGKKIGIVGPSGSGKTTFLRLLMRFIDSDKGTIKIDERDVSEYNPRSIRERVGYVEQDPYIFDSSLEDNIRYGDEKASNEQLMDAVEKAALKDVLESFDDGLETELGESGDRMSGGEKKRVAIARSLVSDPSILVLDEATSHVDNITESKIQRSIITASKERTTIMVAHRLSTVRNADKILVFEDGSIIERGSHEKLLEEGGLYKDLWNKHVGIVDYKSEES